MPWQVSLVHAKPRAGGENLLFRAMSRDGTRSVAIKAHGVPQQNRLQFEALERLHAASGLVVEPYFLDPDHRYLAMAWLEGPTPMEAMSTPRRFEAIERAGVWLAELHRKTADKVRRPDPLIAERQLPPGADPVLVERLTRLKAGLESTETHPVLLHTDFQLHNLIDRDGELIGIDPSAPAVGHAAWDLARFAIGLAMFRRRAAQGPEPWPGTLAEDRDVFLASYGGIPGDQVEVFAYVEAFLLARQWSRAAARNEPGRNWRLPVLRRMMRRRGLLDPAPT